MEDDPDEAPAARAGGVARAAAVLGALGPAVLLGVAVHDATAPVAPDRDAGVLVGTAVVLAVAALVGGPPLARRAARGRVPLRRCAALLWGLWLALAAVSAAGILLAPTTLGASLLAAAGGWAAVLVVSARHERRWLGEAS